MEFREGGNGIFSFAAPPARDARLSVPTSQAWRYPAKRQGSAGLKTSRSAAEHRGIDEFPSGTGSHVKSLIV